MDAIFDKALKRRDCSGVMDKDTSIGDTDKSNTSKPNANVGKVVNLMAIDANKISLIVGSAYLLYGGELLIITAEDYLLTQTIEGPLEITLALIFLFKYVCLSFSANSVLEYSYP